MKHFFKNALCMALAFFLITSIAIPCFAETLERNDNQKEHGQFTQTVINEYDYIVELRGQTDTELASNGVSADEINALRSNSVEDELMARRELSDDVLINYYGYTEQQIQILHNYNGGKLEDYPELRSIFAEVSFSSFTILKATTQEIKIKFSWAWDAMPIWTWNDAIAVAWCPTYGFDNGTLRLDKNNSLNSITYKSNRYSHRVNYFFKDEMLNKLSKSEFPMSKTFPEVFDYDLEWASEGIVVLDFNKPQDSAPISSLDIVVSYGHSELNIGSVSVGLDSSGTGNIGISFEKGVNEVCSEICFVDINPFVDVSPEDSFYRPVMWAVDHSYTGGTDSTHFSPKQQIMRCDAVVFLYAIAGRPTPASTACPFVDVKKSAWYYNAVVWAWENGIVGGTDKENKYFSPKQKCVRADFLQILYKYTPAHSYSIDNPYSDVKPGAWYYDAAIWAFERRLEQGEYGKFNHNMPCNRGDAVTYLYRLITGRDLES